MKLLFIILIPCCMLAVILKKADGKAALQARRRGEEMTREEWAETRKTYRIAHSAAFGCVMLGLFLLSLYGAIYYWTKTPEDWFSKIFMTVLTVIFLYGVLIGCFWKMEVDHEHIVYHDYFGIKHYYTFTDFTRGSRTSDGGMLFYIGRKPVIRVDGLLCIFQTPEFIFDLREYGVLIDDRGMTLQRFIIRPAMWYFWLTGGGLVVQVYLLIFGNLRGKSLIGLVVVAIFWAIIFLDACLDRFAVEGTQVTRKRGLHVVRFDLSDVEYTKVKKGFLRDNIEFYIEGKKVTHIWSRNDTKHFLEKKLCTVGVRRRREKIKR